MWSSTAAEACRIERPGGHTHVSGLRAGNLEDITLRAIRVLRAADLVLAEDTRRTRQLLTHLDIRGAALTSFHEHNERGKQEQVSALMVLQPFSQVAG